MLMTFEMSSPVIGQITGGPSGSLNGKAAVGAYWQKSLARARDLRYSLKTVLTGVDSITLYYEGVGGVAAEVSSLEVFGLNEQRQVVKAVTHYEVAVK